MKLRRNKKGFTIIELVIVIAVIGILAAVLIPTFVNLTNKANEAADNALVNNLNKALKMEEQEPGHQKAPTLEGAIKDLEDQGYLLENLVTKSGKDLIWSQSENQFLLNNEKKSGLDYWQIVDAVPENLDAQKYSYYAGKNFNQTNVTVVYGFDAGRKDTIENITYVGGDTPKAVNIRTNSAGQNLTINAELDTVNHYNDVGRVDAQNVDKNNCYNEYGNAGYIKLTEGKVVAKAGSKIGVVFAANNDENAVVVLKEGDASIEKAFTALQPVSDTNAARVNGIALEYSFNDEQAASMSDAQKAQALVTTNNTVVEPAAVEAVDDLAAEEIEKDNEKGANYVARIGAKGYKTFKEAVEAAKENDRIIIVSDFVIDSDIGSVSNNKVVNALKNTVVINDSVKLTFTNGSKLYMLHDGYFDLNDDVELTVYFEPSEEGQKTGFMNCNLGILPGPLNPYCHSHAEYNAYKVENANAKVTIFTDFHGLVEDDNDTVGLYYYNGNATGLTGGEVVADGFCYDESIGSTDPTDLSVHNIDQNEYAYIYVESGHQYVWELYNASVVSAKDGQGISIVDGSDSNIVTIKGVSKGQINGCVRVIIDGSQTYYFWFKTTGVGGTLPSNPPLNF